MSFIPYSRQSISSDDIDAVTAVLRSDFLTQGSVVPTFEETFANRHKVRHAIAVSNATAALHIGCLALGVGPTSLVWTSPNSFIASANCALYCGADIDFVDIDPITRNMSATALAEKLTVADRAGRLPDVVIPVDFSGLAVDLKEMRELADYYGFKILEDASHATGASYLGEPVGSGYADATVFSFHAVKIVTTAEGGMITTNDEVLARQLRLLRSHGMTRELNHMECQSEGGWYYEQVALGFNYRLTDLQAALGLSQLDRLDTWQQRRTELADRYDRLFEGMPIKLPARIQDCASAWHLYAIELGDEVEASRAAVFAGMRDAGIGVNVHYIPIHTQPYFRNLGFRPGDFVNAERYYSKAISIPLFPAMSEAQQEIVVETMRRLIG